MTYTKPEILVCGEAVDVIQAGKQIPGSPDSHVETTESYEPEEE